MTDLVDQLRSAANDLSLINQNISNNSKFHASSQCPETRPTPNAKLVISFDTSEVRHSEAFSQCPENSSSSSSMEAKLGISFETRSDIQLMDVDSLEDVFQSTNSQNSDKNNNIQKNNQNQHHAQLFTGDRKASKKYLEWQETLDSMTSPARRRTNRTRSQKSCLTNRNDGSDLSSMDSSDEFDQIFGTSKEHSEETGLETLEEPDYHDSECDAENSSSAENNGKARNPHLTIIEYPKESPVEEDFTMIDDTNDAQGNYYGAKKDNDSNIRIDEIVEDFFDDDDDAVRTANKFDDNKIVAESSQDFSNRDNNFSNCDTILTPPPALDNYVRSNPPDDKQNVVREASDSTMSDSENSVAIKEFLNTVHCTPKLRLAFSEDPNKNKLVIMEPLETIDEENFDDDQNQDVTNSNDQHEPTFLERLENIFFWRRKEEEVKKLESEDHQNDDSEIKLNQKDSEKYEQSVTVTEQLLLGMDTVDEFALRSHEPSVSTPILRSSSNKALNTRRTSNSELNLSSLEFSDDENGNIFYQNHNDNIFMNSIDSEEEKKIVQEIMGDGLGSTATVISDDDEIIKNLPPQSIQQGDKDDEDDDDEDEQVKEFSVCLVPSKDDDSISMKNDSSSKVPALTPQNNDDYDGKALVTPEKEPVESHKITKEEVGSSQSSLSSQEDEFTDALNEFPTIKSMTRVDGLEEDKKGKEENISESKMKPPSENTEDKSLIRMLEGVSKEGAQDCKFVMQLEAAENNSPVIVNNLEFFGKLEENLSESEMTKLQQIQIVDTNQNSIYCENERQQDQKEQSLEEFEPDLTEEVKLGTKIPDDCQPKIVNRSSSQATVDTKESCTSDENDDDDDGAEFDLTQCCDDDNTSILSLQEHSEKENNITIKTSEEVQRQDCDDVSLQSTISDSLPMAKEADADDDDDGGGGGGEDLEQMEEPVPVPVKEAEISPVPAEAEEKEETSQASDIPPEQRVNFPISLAECPTEEEASIENSRWNRMDGYIDVLYVKIMTPPSLKSSSSSILKNRKNKKNDHFDGERTKCQEKIIRFPLHKDDAESVMVLAVNSHLPQLHARYLDMPKQVNFKIPKISSSHHQQDGRQLVATLKIRCPLAIPVSFKLCSVLQLDMTPDVGVVFPQEVIRVQVHCRHCHTGGEEDKREWLDQLKIEGILVYAAPFIFNRGYLAVPENLTAKDIQEFWGKLSGPRFRYAQTKFIPIQLDDEWIPFTHESKEGGLLSLVWRALKYLNIFKCSPPPTTRLMTLSLTDLLNTQASPLGQMILRRHMNIYRMLQSRVDRLNDHRTILITGTIICTVGAALFYFVVYRPEMMRTQLLATNFWDHCTAIWTRLLQTQ